ncbi:MAG TPA: pyridoxamine 5'-phosphate oxidase family protein [Bacteroidota bacterium]|nr:pyridoxamine 5'-phosphate oxidase family protein [Bacteroidota bacterium]
MNKMTAEQLLAAVRELITSTEYCFFITDTPDGHPHARLMQPYEPETDLTLYFGASPRSRKVRELSRQSKISLAFYNQQQTAYVTLLGSASTTDDPSLCRKYWRANWNDLFPGGPESSDYILIRFVPDRIEMMNYAHQVMPQPYSLHPTILRRDGQKWTIAAELES